jgi:hypothetical protein
MEPCQVCLEFYVNAYLKHVFVCSLSLNQTSVLVPTMFCAETVTSLTYATLLFNLALMVIYVS